MMGKFEAGDGEEDGFLFAVFGRRKLNFVFCFIV